MHGAIGDAFIMQGKLSQQSLIERLAKLEEKMFRLDRLQLRETLTLQIIKADEMLLANRAPFGIGTIFVDELRSHIAAQINFGNEFFNLIDAPGSERAARS